MTYNAHISQLCSKSLVEKMTINHFGAKELVDLKSSAIENEMLHDLFPRVPDMELNDRSEE